MPSASIPSGTFRYPRVEVVQFGPGSFDRLPLEVERIGGSRVLAVVTPSVAADGEVLARLEGLLGPRLAGTFTGVRPHAPYESVLAAADAARSVDADSLVSVGGGSAVDTARIAGLCVAEDLRSEEALSALRARPEDGRVVIPTESARALPLVAVPTTLSAAEFSVGGSVISERRHAKELFMGQAIVARTVILDPDLAVRTPASIWVTTGIRAVDHAVETVYSPYHSPVTDALCVDAIRRLVRSLPAALDDPSDVAARADAQLAAWMSYFGVPSATLNLSHAIGHQIGARYGIAHGHTTSIVLPHVIRFVGPVAGAQLRLIAEGLDLEVAGGSDEDVADAVAAAIEALIDRLGLPRRLSDLGIALDEVDALVSDVFGDPLVAGSPRAVDADQVAALLEHTR